MNNNKPKFQIGDWIRVKSLEEAKRLDEIRIVKPLRRFLGNQYRVKGIRTVSGMFYYYLEERSRTCVHEALLEAYIEDKDSKEHLQLDNICVRGHIKTGLIDVGKITGPSIMSWKLIYISIDEFIKSAPPQIKSFIAGQLCSLTDRIMNEMLKEE